MCPIPTELCGHGFIVHNLVAWCLIHSLYLNYGGGGRIRTCVALRAADLQSAPINHSGTPPDATP